MKITVWGCRGSLPAPGPEKTKYGGNTSCVQILHEDTCIILDGGSGIQQLGTAIPPNIKRLDILLTHLHIDHIVGMGFFGPFYNPGIEVHIWGPMGSAESLEQRLRRYFSPPLFPVRLQDLPCQPIMHELHQSEINIGGLNIYSEYLCHPGPTVGYRISNGKSVLAYMPDHEPNLGSIKFPDFPEWTSGFTIAENADLLMHDGQYRGDEYQTRIGWGHSSMEDAIKFASMTHVKKMLLFHHDPMHTDDQLDKFFDDTSKGRTFPFQLEMCKEGSTYELP